MRRFASLTAVLLGWSLPAWGVEFAVAPIVQHPVDDSITVAWTLRAPVAGLTLAWGAGGALDQTVVIPADELRTEVTLNGLVAGVEYRYELRDASGPVAPGGSFWAVDEPGTPFRFLLFGDTRNRHDVHAQIVERMAAVEGARFAVQTGDLVATGGDEAQWDTYFGIEHPLMRSVPVYPVIGNHDEYDDRALNLTDRFVLPTNSPAPEEYYSFEWGNLHVTVLDGHTRNSLPWIECIALGLYLDDCFSPAQMAWLEADLRAAAADPEIDHLIVAVHIGPYSSKEDRSGNAQMRELMPLFEETGVSLIVSGHDHYYERGESANGIPYIITGGGGAPLYAISDPSRDPHTVAMNRMVEHFIVVDVDGRELSATVVDIDGNTFDRVSVAAIAECSTDSDCDATPLPDCEAPLVARARCSVGSRCIARCVDPADVQPDADVDAAPDAALPDAEDDASGVLPLPDAGDGSGGGGAQPAAAADDSAACAAGSAGAGDGIALLALGAWLAARRRSRL